MRATKKGLGCFFILVIFLTSPLAYGSEELTLSGQILDEQNNAITKFTAKINGRKAKSSQDGSFTLRIKNTDIVKLSISAEGYFPIVQSFSPLELISQADHKIIPPISLVEKRSGRVMLAFGGDVMMGRRYKTPRGGEEVLIRKGRESQDTKAIVQHVRPYFQVADYGSVNLESQLMAAAPKRSASKLVTYFSPPETVKALQWAGVDYVTLGNNHTYDNLEEGLVSTLDILSQSSLGYSGAGLNEAQALQAYHTKISEQNYSFLGYVGWTGTSRPHQAAEGPDKGGAALGTMTNIIDTVAREVAQNNITVVQYHGSLEYKDGPTGMTEQRLKSAIDHGADLAIAHHPHVVQGFEIYKDRLIAYSLGNFIFDQYFYGPQFSYMLYVWMDGEKFHRAEVVPIYIKGYKPTPATGQARQAILQRVATLSARRNIGLSYSGGHGILTAQLPKLPSQTSYEVDLSSNKDDAQVISLDNCAVGEFITGATSDNEDIQYRLGQELLRRGDFENFDVFSAPERGWLRDGEKSGPTVERAYQGKRSFKVTPQDAQETSLFGMKVFTRMYKSGNPMTFSGQVFSEKDVLLNVYLQGRPSRGGLAKSLKEAPRQRLGTVKLKKNMWQDVTVNFNTPRVGIRSFRIMVEASSPSGGPVPPLYYDDVALIQWQTAYGQADKKTISPSPNQTTHVALRDTGTSGGKVTLHFDKHLTQQGAVRQACSSSTETTF